jgi:hypothetical protein
VQEATGDERGRQASERAFLRAAAAEVLARAAAESSAASYVNNENEQSTSV